MVHDRNDPPHRALEPSPAARLDSWKEIAAYLKHSVRTVRRWQEEGLPVHRHAHKKRAGVYAYRPELDAWWNDGHARLEEMERTQPARERRRALPWGIAAVLVVELAVGAYFYLHRTPKLTEKDSIVVADFTNTTGDPVFDGTLRQGLSAQLEQTPFLQMISGDQIAQTLRFMEKPPDTRLTPEVAREVCQRVNATTEIEGSIAALGSQYVIGLSAVNCHTGESLAQEQVTAAGKEKVLTALGGTASELRSKLGESPASLENFDVPLYQATTSSLEALQAWTLGTQSLSKGDSPSAISFLQRAVSLDPNFAEAYSTLGVTYGFVGQLGLAAENTRKAYDLRERTSEHEKFSIISNYCFWATGDMEKAVQIAEQWAKLYPRDTPAYFSLTSAYQGAGRNDEWLAAAREALRLDPTPFAYNAVASGYVTLGRLDEARATIQQAEKNHIDPAAFRGMLYGIAFMQNDSPTMDRQLTAPWIFSPPWMLNSPSAADEAQSWTAAYDGHLHHARELTERAIASARQQGANGLAADLDVGGGVIEALFGNFPEAREAVKDAGDLSTADHDLEGVAGIVWAVAGDAQQARKLAGDLNKRFPEATYIRFGALPAIQGLLALHRGEPTDATKALDAISSYELVPP